MKKGFYILMSVCILTACSNGTDQGGTVNDGIHSIDKDGALEDSTALNPRTDTLVGEHRTDISTRGEKATRDTSGNRMVPQPQKGKMIMKDSVQAEIRQ